MKILVTGLPGSGKTVFSNKLFDLLDDSNLPVVYYNGDHMREQYNDWDFSEVGRSRQLIRMTECADKCDEINVIVVCDFICPRNSYRDYFNADITIWMDTIKKSRYEDTNNIFEIPDKYDIKIETFEYKLEDVVRLIDVKRRSRN
jgi:adenylylsulfate kinase